MSGIFGIFHRDSRPVTPVALDKLRSVMGDWGPDGCSHWFAGPVGLGQALFKSTPESEFERLPWVEPAGVFAFTAAGRVDNRDELASALGIAAVELARMGDGELMRLAYCRWGEECTGRIFGDWSLAAWHANEKRLFLARDHHGNTSLYYYVDAHVFAFASSRKALMALNLCPIELDELYLAQVLVSWPAFQGERTVHKPLRRLPPAHSLSVSPDQLHVDRYWRIEDTNELVLPKRTDYIEAFNEIYGKAVASRLRADGPVAVTLSGGLDSGSVAAVAAGMLRERGLRLSAFTSVPLSDTSGYVVGQIGDEFPFAQATALFAGNVDHYAVNAADITPIQAIRRVLQIHDEPCHGAGNHYWLLKLQQAAREQGCKVLLTGQLGNPGISWTGDMFSQTVATQLRLLGWHNWAKAVLRRMKQQMSLAAPQGMVQFWQRRNMIRNEWCRGSALLPEFADRINLLGQRLADPELRPKLRPLDLRGFLKPGRSIVGALHAQMGAADHLDIRDPTGDARLLAFTFSVPDHIFIDPETGMDRWLIREAMKDRLPDKVRLNRSYGRQSGDLVPRLRACSAEVEECLDSLAGGPAADYVDVKHMRQVWRRVQTETSPQTFRDAAVILSRGIMAGLFVNGFCRQDQAK